MFSLCWTQQAWLQLWRLWSQQRMYTEGGQTLKPICWLHSACSALLCAVLSLVTPIRCASLAIPLTCCLDKLRRARASSVQNWHCLLTKGHSRAERISCPVNIATQAVITEGVCFASRTPLMCNTTVELFTLVQHLAFPSQMLENLESS